MLAKIKKYFSGKEVILSAATIVVFAFFLYLTTWHKSFEGYEAETVSAAIKLSKGGYGITRTGVSSLILYLPFVYIFHLFGSQNFQNLSIVPIIYSVVTVGLIFYIVWYLTKKINISLAVSLLILSCSVIWPYANIGMEYQVMFYVALLLFFLLRWKNGECRLIWSSIIFALLSVAKSYGPMFGLPYLLFIFFTLPPKNRLKTMVVALLPAIIVYLINISFLKYFNGSITGVYSVAHEFQIITWWEGFYGVFFSVGKSIFIFNPLLILALFRWKTFFKEHKATAYFILVSGLLLLLLNAPFSYWTDETLTVRKLTPVIGLLHLPLLYYFKSKLSWNKLKTWMFVAFIGLSFYVQMLGSFYYYGKQLAILREGNLDSLQNMRYVPQLSLLPIYNALLTGYISKVEQSLVYSESSWFRWTVRKPEIIFSNIKINLKQYQAPDIYWIREGSARHHVIFIGLIVVDVALLAYVCRRFVKEQSRENV